MKKILCLILASIIVISVIGGCSTENWDWELQAEGVLSNYQRIGNRVNFTLDNKTFSIDLSRWTLYLDKMYVEIGDYYYLYKDTIGSITLSCPYKLTKEKIN